MKTLLSQEKTQMALTHFSQNGDCSKVTHADNLLAPENDNNTEPEPEPQIPSDSQDVFDKFGEPEISPRIGDEYQAQLPTLVKSHSIKRTISHPGQKFLVGLPIMLTWINTNDIKSIKAETIDLPTAEEMSCQGYILVPGLVDDCWDALEKDSFILGIYIFEKDFDDVKRFVETKNMGNVLSFYYGRFYRTREYHRWKDSRKRKKGIYGPRIFSGARQNEFLSRILVGVSEERRNDILEASKLFGDEKMTLSEYVFSLKSMVGIKVLIDAVGIGKGKLDLTEMPLENSRSNPARPEVPTGKALSALTDEEIVKILSGDYRLSKARANDIFWEAVWPRLLFRGWHSEQPKNQGYVKHGLVFLIPGIKKFSRRKLVRGEHYFDSVTDVLGKVAKEPELINLDLQEDEAPLSEKKKNKKKVDYESPPVFEKKSGKHCYLQPRTPVRNVDVIKFTVVDTSLSGGKIRELRAFPDDQDRAVDSDEDEIAKKPGKKIARSVSPDPKNKKDKKVPKPRKTKRDNVENVGPVFKRSRTLAACSREKTNGSPSGVNGITESLYSKQGPSQDKAASSSGGGHDGPVENGRPQLLWDLNLPQPPPDFENSEQSIGLGGGSNEPDNNGLPDPPAAELGIEQGGGSNGLNNNVLPAPAAEQDLGQGGGLNGLSNNVLPGPPAAEQGIGQGGGLNGLGNNVLPGPPAAEQGIGQGGGLNGPGNNILPAPPANEARPDQAVDLNPRRHSTRSRAPTKKVVEAVIGGHLTMSRKRRARGIGSNEKAAKRGNDGAGPSEPANGPESGEGENGAANPGNRNVEPRDPPDANGDLVLGQ